jgi:hypothetical protein
MDRDTRDKFASGTKGDLTSGNACWQTPPAVYMKLAEDFGPFDLDLTGDAMRALLPTWFGPGSPAGEFDALTARWASHGRSGYSNPPYGPFVQKMLAKAKGESANGFTTVLLLPMRATKAFHAHVLSGANELLFCDKRLCFYEDGLPRLNAKEFARGRLVADSALFDSIVVVYRPEWVKGPTAGAWKVPPHVSREALEMAAERLRAKAA